MNNERNEIQAEEAKIETHEEDERVLRNGTADQAEVENVNLDAVAVNEAIEILILNNVNDNNEVLEEVDAEMKVMMTKW